MPPKPEQILRQIEKARKLKGRTVRDCATLLQISKRDYLQFERGEYYLSLPEIELLAFFLNVPPQELFRDESQDQVNDLMQDQERQDKYKQLRHKMIQARINIEQNKSLEKIHELTQIPVEQLESYQKGDYPIPLDDLYKIIEGLKLTPEAFFIPETLQDETEKVIPIQEAYQPEFSEGERESPDGVEDPYIPFFNALKLIPIEDQADIAKALLNKLKTK